MRAGAMIGVAGITAVALAGVVLAQPQDSGAPSQQQTSPDPIGEVLKNVSPIIPPDEEAPPAPGDVPAVIAAPPAPPRKEAPAPPGRQAETEAAEADAQDEEEEETGEAETETAAASPVPLVEPGRRTRHPVAVIQALDKITAETMRFEVRVGGPPVRYKGLVFTVRACEASASDELTEDAVAYLEVRSQPRGLNQQTPARQVFRGWMYASAPAVMPLEHPIYDAWVVDCRA